jgi:TPR repeat protein
MFKRYLPLLFVVLVVIATALVYLALRERPTDATATAPAPDGTPEFRVESEDEYRQMLAALGTSTEDVEAWARTQGFPPKTYTESAQPPLERNYGRMRDERLLNLAEQGDRWAMQFLAQRIGPEMPLEAIEWHRRAALHGSAYAAFKLGLLYQEIARWALSGAGNPEQVNEIAQREDPLAYTSLAWMMVAEYQAGLPPGAMSATLAGFQAPDDAITQACIRAAGLLAELAAERESLGIAIDDRKPPLAVELPAEELAGYCEPEVFPRTDYAGCETVRLVGDLGAVTAHRCR